MKPQSLAFLGGLIAFLATLDLSNSFQSSLPSKTPLSVPGISTGTRNGPWSTSSSSDYRKKQQFIQKTSTSTTTTTTTQLEVSPLTAIASSPIGAVSVLAGIVLIHEAGHYLAARTFNISVVEFSIGFGPKLVGFEAIGNEFNLRALPLGGYVRFPENYNITVVEELRNAAREAFRKRREEENWTAWQDAINILTLGTWDEQRRQKRKREAARRAAADSSSSNNNNNNNLAWWKKVFQRGKARAKPEPVDPEDFEIPYFDDPNLLQNRPWQERAVVLSGGVIFNMILAFLLYFGEINLGTGIPQPVFDSGVVVSQAPRSDGPSAGLLRQGDIIVGINGQPISMTTQSPKGAQKQVSDIIGAIRDTPSGQSLKLQVKRGGEASQFDVTVKPQKSGSIQTIGVFLGPNFKEIQKIKSDDIMEAAVLAYRYLSQMISQTLDGLLSLLGMVLMGKGPPPGQSVSGPIGLIRSGTEVVSTRDVTAVLLFAAALSVNLGVINALPLPALDGGQLVFVLAEAVTGKKVNQQLQEGITSVAILLLLLVSVSTAFSDVGSIINGR